jgi:hypothetical protein
MPLLIFFLEFLLDVKADIIQDKSEYEECNAGSKNSLILE